MLQLKRMSRPKPKSHKSNLKNPADVVWRQLYVAYKGRARRNNREFSLTQKDFVDLCSKNCYYDNTEPKETYQIYNKKRYEATYQGYTFDEEKSSRYVLKTNGIDRIDSSKGYTLDNCVPCCKVCNEMKMARTEEEFLAQITKIYKYKVLKGEQNE